MNSKEIERLLITAHVKFPEDKEVIKEVKSVRKYEKGLKNAFMDAIN